MKRISVLVVASLLVGAAAFAQVTQVVSRNAVGYVKVVAKKGTFNMLRHDFLSIDGSAITVNDVFGNDLPLGSSVFLWDKVNQGYRTENRTFAGWSPGTNDLTDAGRGGLGFWLSIPGTAPSNEYTIFLLGEVPDRFTRPTSSVAVVGSGGFTMAGYPYPVSVLWTNTQLAKSASLGDTLFYWTTNQSYGTLNFTFAGWSDKKFVVEPGMGFWYTTANPKLWEEPKPYTWP